MGGGGGGQEGSEMVGREGGRGEGVLTGGYDVRIGVRYHLESSLFWGGEGVSRAE